MFSHISFEILGSLCLGKNENGLEQKSLTTSGEIPKGLQIWRDAVASCETAAQLAMCTYALESAVAWDKSIMKAVSSFSSFIFN